ncbi:hypothetical protein Aconfl_16510 [Algoriphagus confluentis]|uniref:Uncharacterized protein n=1 Tax=Algoriphagus confluentis TaxID=1697556 RepID=A0ABQ6PM26_9BACT|nr:hypothetical protein Aconfl_16510 [Algoriphagus confluentis]
MADKTPSFRNSSRRKWSRYSSWKKNNSYSRSRKAFTIPLFFGGKEEDIRVKLNLHVLIESFMMVGLVSEDSHCPVHLLDKKGPDHLMGKSHFGKGYFSICPGIDRV